MKKVLFCLSLIFGLLVLNMVPSFAMEASFETIGGLGDLGYGLIGGAIFDFDGTEYTIEDFDNLSDALKQEAAERKAREFLQAYCMARGIPIPNIDPDLPATTGKEFYKSQYFDSANRTVWNNYKLGRTSIEQQEALRFPISPQSFSDWTGYSSFWYEKYISQFEVRDEPDVPEIPSWASIYLNHLSVIWLQADNENQKRDFLNVPVKNGAYGEVFFWNNRTDYSYVRIYQNSGGWIPIDPIDIYIETNQNGGYDINTSTLSYILSGVVGYVFHGSTHNYSSFYPSDYNQNGIWIGNGQGRVSDVSTSAHFDSLQAAFIYIDNYFVYPKSISVDGNIWLGEGGLAPANPTIPSFPDVIGGDSEDPIPAYDIVFPNTSDYEGTFDITSLFDAIKEAIIGASDSDDSTDSTLTREKVTDTYKDKVGEAVGEAVKTIDDVMEDSFPLEGTLNFPNLPPIPMLPLDNAFAGTTILSELIDACQQILPSPLALAFWGMIFILFIIGLIRILHK